MSEGNLYEVMMRISGVTVRSPIAGFRCGRAQKLKMVIAALGGPSRVATDYGFSVQRVCNWYRRGIPATVILDNPGFAGAIFAAGYRRNEEVRQVD